MSRSISSKMIVRKGINSLSTPRSHNHTITLTYLSWGRTDLVVPAHLITSHCISRQIQDPACLVRFQI